jgi:hypothetical protein
VFVVQCAPRWAATVEPVPRHPAEVMYAFAR